LKHRKKRPQYEQAEEFFASDPIKINGPPPRNSNIRERQTVEDLEEMMANNEPVLKTNAERTRDDVHF
uniref:Vps4_C domain-containing protein n=1 Tax=Thelazia callipaeda TaxID=103827 RepID=A0A0N5DA48_THECL